MTVWKGLAIGALLAGCTDIGDEWMRADEQATSITRPLTFEADIKPMLQRYGCMGCHTPGGGGSGGLDVSTPEGLQAGGDSGKAAVYPCDHGKSYMWYRVRWCEMPLIPGYPDCVDRDDVAIIAAWIDQGGGAAYDPAVCAEPELE